jgi:hypothetical protein
VRSRRIRLREKELSRLMLKPKLGYKLPAEALLIEVPAIVLPKQENNKNSQNNSSTRIITGKNNSPLDEGGRNNSTGETIDGEQ